MLYLQLVTFALLCFSVALAVRHTETIEDKEMAIMKLVFDASIVSNVSLAVTPTDLKGKWMNSDGLIVVCNTIACQFSKSESVYKLHAAQVTLKGSKPIEAVALGNTGWAAVRLSPAGIAWLREKPGTIWWDKLPASPVEVAINMKDTRWHNDVGETIRVISATKGLKVCFGSSAASADCFFLQQNTEWGYLTFSDWVCIDYFKNSRGNMEVHWRLKEGTHPSNKLRDVVWYTDSLKPEVETLVGTWMNTFGEVVTCTSDKCSFEGSDSVFQLSSSRFGVALDSTGWIAVDFDQAGITWEKLGEDKTLWWNKLPSDPAAVLHKLQEVRHWTNTEGLMIIVVDNLVIFNRGSPDPLTIEGQKLMLNGWVVVDFFENHRGSLEVLWRKSSKQGAKKQNQQTIRWTQEFFTASD